MHIELKRINHAVHFEASNSEGNTINFDGSPEIGGEGKGVRPMQSLLMALGGCSGIDVVLILQKQKQTITDFRMGIDGEREQGVDPALWKDIQVVYHLAGQIDSSKAIRAVQLSMDKYCSVAKTLEVAATITWSVILNGEKIS
ncbi:MAG: OsmC family protein [Bacteroidia bacterium]